jgi:hypothetical protein
MKFLNELLGFLLHFLYERYYAFEDSFSKVN